MKALLSLIILSAMVSPAHAESCSRSLERVLEGGQISQKPQFYRALLTVCLEAGQMPNVKSASILSSGSIGIVPRNESLMATASTLSQFCRRFPKEQVLFITTKPQAESTKNQSSQPTVCAKILGHE